MHIEKRFRCFGAFILALAPQSLRMFLAKLHVPFANGLWQEAGWLRPQSRIDPTCRAQGRPDGTNGFDGAAHWNLQAGKAEIAFAFSRAV